MNTTKMRIHGKKEWPIFKKPNGRRGGLWAERYVSSYVRRASKLERKLLTTKETKVKKLKKSVELWKRRSEEKSRFGHD